MAVIGIDIGGTKISGALISDEGSVIRRLNYAIAGKKGKEVGKLARSAVAMLLDSEEAESVKAAGISVPGIARSRGDVWAPNIPGWTNYPLKEEMEHYFRAKPLMVKVESDRTCYILGEKWQGAAKGCNDAIYLSVGTGIGAGIITGGRILRGSEGIAGAVGWMALQRPFIDDYIQCGCFEYYASGAGIALNARNLMNRSADRKGFPEGKAIEEVDAADVFEASFAGNEIAVRVIHKAVEMWGMAAANLISIFDPEKIIFGGGVFGPAVTLMPDIKKEAEKWAQPVSIRKVRFESSFLKGDAGIFGAGLLALHPEYAEPVSV